MSLKSNTKFKLNNPVTTLSCNNSPEKLSTCEKPKQVSASFLFSSCKKKLLLDSFSESIPPVLVADSSDEECYDNATVLENGAPNFESELVHESLEEYSLIRKWLLNSETPNSSSSSDTNSPIFQHNKTDEKLEINAGKAEVNNSLNPSLVQRQEDVIILSSDEEDEQFESCKYS